MIRIIWMSPFTIAQHERHDGAAKQIIRFTRARLDAGALEPRAYAGLWNSSRMAALGFNEPVEWHY